nr:hypothetical protein [uncultured Rhodopila sp.]
MKRVLTATTILAALGSPAFAASFNDINIDATGTAGNTGSVTSLAILQDTTGTTAATGTGTTVNNLVSGETTAGHADKTQALAVRGAWKSISITQNGANNSFSGSLKTAAGSTNATLAATYTGGGNVHSLNVGAAAAPLDPTITVSVNGASNKITDTLDTGSTADSTYTGGALTYALAITGASNILVNSLATKTGITLNETINGSSNTVTNATTSGSAVTTATINQTINGSNGTYVTDYTAGAGGTQTSTLNVDATSVANYLASSDGLNQTTNVTLNGFHATGGTMADVVILQTSNAGGASATVTYNGNGNNAGQLGLIGGTGPAAAYNPAVYVLQSSPGAQLSANVSASGPNYTASFIH